MADSLEHRLLRDISELQTVPYPNIELHIDDEDLSNACLILTVEGYGHLHLTIEFSPDYPIIPPKIRMDSNISHPNVEGNYICASILITQEGYTSAYTLKAIAIQLLSFFGSDRVEQAGGDYSVELSGYRNKEHGPPYICHSCQFGMSDELKEFLNGTLITLATENTSTSSPPIWTADFEDDWLALDSDLVVNTEDKLSLENKEEDILDSVTESLAKVEVSSPPTKSVGQHNLPDEILLQICEKLETEELMPLAEAWPKIGALMTKYDVIRTRELQCFCLRYDYTEAELGVGVTMTPDGKIPMLESEFDLISLEAYYTYGVRRSVQGLPFEHWLPLPLSPDHWEIVRESVSPSLEKLSKMANLGVIPSYQVLYHFMNDVIVKLNKQVIKPTIRSPYYPYEEFPKSALTHASEKAVESYFHLFHLLVCLATEDPSIIQSTNRTLQSFSTGQTSKETHPNLGHLLVASLISDVEMTELIMKTIIRESITRNVVWMLDSKGANMPELVYMEPSPVSHYRLQKTFDASKTSYRLLMFLNLFRTVALGSPRKPLGLLRKEAFERHGAPPRGSTRILAEGIKRIHKVTNFPDFLGEMGLAKPSAAWFTGFLRDCVKSSVQKGYSKLAIGQAEALVLRLAKEPRVERKDVGPLPDKVVLKGLTFFPGKALPVVGMGRGRGGSANGSVSGRGGADWRRKQ